MLGTECCCPVLSTHRGTPRTNGYWPCWTRKSHCRILCEMPSFIIPAPPPLRRDCPSAPVVPPLRDEWIRILPACTIWDYVLPLAKAAVRRRSWKRSGATERCIFCAVGGAGASGGAQRGFLRGHCLRRLGLRGGEAAGNPGLSSRSSVWTAMGETCLRRRKTADSGPYLNK